MKDQAGNRFAAIVEEMIREFLTLTDGIRANERNFDMVLKGEPGFDRDPDVYIANIHARAAVIGGLANTLGALCNAHIEQMVESCVKDDHKERVLALSEAAQRELALSATNNMNRLIEG